MSTRFGFSFWLACGSALLFVQTAQAQLTARPIESTSSTNAAASDPSSLAMATAIGKMNADDVDGAMAKLTEAITLNPKNSAAYVLRASVYCKKKQWPEAEADFKSAAAIDPNNVVLKFNLVEVKFLQKQYDVARPGYVALESDPDMGDFASYKVFLCDLAGGKEAQAQKELDAFNDAGSKASYYFANAAWDIVHKNYDGARDWLASAGRIYAPRKNAYYAEALIYLGYLPLPKSATQAPPQ